MRLSPFAVIYGGTLASVAVLSSTKTVHVGTVAGINAQIAELNANFANYGYGSTPNLPLLPLIPTPGVTAPNAIFYNQTTPPGGSKPDYGTPQSFLLIDAYTTNGYNDPSTPLDALTVDQVLINLILASETLSGIITVQPAAQTIAHNAAGAIALTATGTGLTYQWQINNPNNALGWQSVTNTGPFTTATTASLTITNPVLATYNGASFRCLVNTPGGKQVTSAAVALTVT